MIIVGAPGVGKGTHTERLLNRYPQLSSVSSGDLLRENVRKKTRIGKEAEALMNRGELVPDNVILRLIRNALHPDTSFILDGFPRNAQQAAQLDKLIPINLAIHVHTPFEIIMDRITNRWVHPPSGRTYNTTFNPPKVEGKDDATGEKLVQRDDDKPEVWKARLSQFEESAKPLLQHYEKMGVLWRVEGNSSDEISPKIFEEFDKKFGK
ncbi:adenylate kinase-domain-containing protein [Neohortaea acidophila]|uniref:GTP:AMP phosphotransferase, mitochondrial n=1 Tax=Neohortaea acidophila TaxID=245834 RepID=A0A6A6PRR8_9PEZI|nr:adenylate kinase-domain-containing protein [Neohortaea acidophila]KAF2482354.1 adenylate kinase-domain-containing protein [Neohortaea acidophila]